MTVVVLQQQVRPPLIPQPPLPGVDPWRWWTAEQLAEITQSPIANVQRNWPLLVAALEQHGIADQPVQIAALATVAIETAHTFAPVREAYWLDNWHGHDWAEAWRRENFRYWPYYGRGFIQLTWESNYRRYGDAIGIDLVGQPDKALDPEISADNLARYFVTHGGGPLIPAAARRGDWREVRRLVQGADAGLPELLATVAALQGAAR